MKFLKISPVATAPKPPPLPCGTTRTTLPMAPRPMSKPVVSLPEKVTAGVAPTRTAVSKLAEIQTAAKVNGFQSLPEHIRAEAKERLKFLQYVWEAKRLSPGTPDVMVVLKVAANRAEEFPILRSSGQGGKSQLTIHSYRNWARRLREFRKDNPNADDLMALASSYKRGSVYQTSDLIPAYGDRGFWQDFNAAYLNQNKLDLTAAREVAAFALRKRRPEAPVPSVSQVRTYVRHLPLEVVIAGREGEVAWRNTICDYITRDWSATEPGELLIGDSRDFDTRVRVEKAPGVWIAVRPKLACLMDARSWMPAAWTITAEPVRADTIMRTLLQYIVSTDGQPPAMCYFDNGKDYCKTGFSTPLKIGKYEHSIFKELGIVLTNARPFNARAKTVERFFRDMMKSFDKAFPDYLGSNPMERPDAAGYFDKPEHVMEMPTLDAFTRIFGDWLHAYVSKPKAGQIHKGQSPLDIWQRRRSSARVLTPLETAFAFLLPIGLRKVMRGPAVNFANRRYFSDEVRVGDTVLIKANLWDPDMVLLCRQDGAAIAIARTRLAVRAITGDDAAQNQLLEDQLARQHHQRRMMKEALDTLTGSRQGISVIEFMLSLGSDTRFIKRGVLHTIKGKSHTFKRIAPDENVFDPPALPGEDAPRDFQYDFGDDAPAAAAASGSDIPVADRETLTDFHNFILNNQPEGEDYE